MRMRHKLHPHNKIMGFLQCKTYSVHLHVVMAVFCLSLLLNVLQAVPVSRTWNLADQKNYMAVGDTDDQMIEEDMWEQGTNEQFIHGRMGIQNYDYPGTGANNRHDPGGGGSRNGKNAPP